MNLGTGPSGQRGSLDAVIAVRALAAPETLPRIFGLLAQRGMIASAFGGRREGEWLWLDLQVEASAPELLDILLAKLESLVLVDRAWLVSKHQDAPDQPALRV